MKRSSAELKSMARGALIGNYGLFIGAIVLSGLIKFLSSYLINVLMDPKGNIIYRILDYIIGFLFSLILQLLTAGLMKIALNISRQEPIRISNLFFAFTHHPDRFLTIGLIFTTIQFIIITIPLALISQPDFSSRIPMADPVVQLITVYAYLGKLLLIAILGEFLFLIITLGASMATFLLIDYADLSAINALKESWHMMRGNKWDYFYVTFLTFLGLGILGVFSCGIAFLWICPYIYVTKAMYYNSLMSMPSS